LNKVNLCWVFSDGQKGHEIQSTTLATAVAHKHLVFNFKLKQPWLSFAPRMFPLFVKGLEWQSDQRPNFNVPADIIITTGRKAAAVGKYIKSMSVHHKPHIQILNPKDNLQHYDLVLLPEHDQINGKNVIVFNGSIHPFNANWFDQHEPSSPWNKRFLAIILGNPAASYFNNDFAKDIQLIRQHFPDLGLYFCGSPRLNTQFQHRIKEQITTTDKFWFSSEDGANPYQLLLKHAHKLFITADSINMLSEAAASKQAVSILGNNHITSSKHLKFISNNQERFCELPSLDKGVAQPQAIEQILNHHLMNRLISACS